MTYNLLVEVVFRKGEFGMVVLLHPVSLMLFLLNLPVTLTNLNRNVQVAYKL